MDSQRLNIVHLIEPGSGGTMRHVLDLARAQADTSHNVAIVYSPLRLEENYKTQLLQLPNVKLYELPMQRAGPRLADLGNLFHLVKILQDEKPDILHAHSTKAGLLARLARIFAPVRVIYTSHAMMSMNPDLPPAHQKIYAAYEKIMSWLTDRVIVLSRHEYDHVRDLGVAAKKIVMAQNGTVRVPLSDRTAMRAEQNISDDQRVVGFVGRLTAQKNPELAVRAFAKAREQIPDLLFYVIGDGELMLSCLSVAEELGVGGAVRWLGGIDALPHYAVMDVLLATSRYEGMPYSFLEALGAGVPIVTTDIGGSESCVIPGQTGEIVAAEPDALADALVKILGDETLRDAMHFGARAHAQHFGIAQMLQGTQAIYADALGPAKK